MKWEQNGYTGYIPVIKIETMMERWSTIIIKQSDWSQMHNGLQTMKSKYNFKKNTTSCSKTF